MSKAPDRNDASDAEAAEWFTLLHSGEVTDEVRQQFEAWLHADRIHKSAYQMYEQAYRDLDFIALQVGVDVDRFLGRKKTIISRFTLPKFFLPSGHAAAWGAVAAMALALLSTTLLHVGGNADPGGAEFKSASIISTYIGETREAKLEDGSRVTLGGRSRLQVSFTEVSRSVELLEGEAFFDVAKDSTRPFLVSSQDTLIRVVGTQFNVKQGADIVHVDVVEGVVEVMKKSAAAEATVPGAAETADRQILTAGERLSAPRLVALPDPRQTEKVEPGAWRNGRFVYENASLAEIVEDLNRYSERPIFLESDDVGGLRSTIAFRVDEIDQLFDVIAAIHPVEIHYSGTGTVVIARIR